MHEDITPENSGWGRARDLRDRPKENYVGQVAEENTVGGFQFGQQAGLSRNMNSGVRCQEPRGLVHGYTPAGEKLGPL